MGRWRMCCLVGGKTRTSQMLLRIEGK
jgi:hypothetical protein